MSRYCCMDFNINRFLKCFWIAIVMFLCVYLLLLHVVPEHKLKDGGPTRDAVVSMYLRETITDRRTYANDYLRYGNFHVYRYFIIVQNATKFNQAKSSFLSC